MLKPMPQLLVRLMIGAALLLMLACGTAEEATPTSSAPTPTPTLFVPAVPAVPVLATATPTPLPGVTAVPTATSTPVPVGDQPKYGGVLRFANSAQHTLDTIANTGSNYGAMIGEAAIFNQLVRVNNQDWVTVEADLAESFSVSGDGTVWKFQIRQGVVDHEGDPYTVDDAYWGVLRIIERPNGVQAFRQSCLRSYLEDVWDENMQALPNGGAEITGANELTVRLKAPAMSFIPCIANHAVVFQPSKYVKLIDTDPSGETRDLTVAEYVGTGPFKFKDMRLDDFFAVERYDNYFREGLPYLDGIEVFVMPEQSTWEAAFSTGRIDFNSNSVGPYVVSNATVDQMKRVLGDTVQFDRVLAMGLGGFDVNVRRPPFGPAEDPNAKKLRWAIQIAIDRGEINELVYDSNGYFTFPYFVGWSWIHTEQEWLANFQGFDPSPEAKARDMAEARQIMEELGYGPDNRLSFTFLASPTGVTPAYAQVVARQLRDLYMDIEVVTSPERTAISRTGDFDIVTFMNGASFPDPDTFNTDINLEWGKGGQRVSGWTNPEWLAMHEQQALAQTLEERAVILRQMAQIWHEDSLRIGTVRPEMNEGWRTYIKGWISPPYHFIQRNFERVWIDKS